MLPPLRSPFFSFYRGWVGTRELLGGLCPHSPRGRALRPRGLCGTAVPAPTCRRSARAWLCHARHPGDFRFTTKVTKGVSGGAPLNPHWGAIIIPPAARACMRLPLPQKATPPSTAKTPPRMRNPYTSTTNTARVESGGIQGGPPPCAGGPGTRRFLAYLCLLSLREKVGRGMGRSAHTWGSRSQV